MANICHIRTFRKPFERIFLHIFEHKHVWELLTLDSRSIFYVPKKLCGAAASFPPDTTPRTSYLFCLGWACVQHVSEEKEEKRESEVSASSSLFRYRAYLHIRSKGEKKDLIWRLHEREKIMRSWLRKLRFVTESGFLFRSVISRLRREEVKQLKDEFFVEILREIVCGEPVLKNCNSPMTTLWVLRRRSLF